MHDSRRIEQTAAEWLARSDAGDWNESDAAALDQWLASAPRHRVGGDEKHEREIVDP